jgi:vancomycin resistance protein YoaR
LGGWTRDRADVKAPVSFNGVLVDDWGGGVCQVSTTLYNAALLAGLRIDERHPHRFAPNYVAPGRDSAVAVSDADLRFTNTLPYTITVQASVDHERILVELTGRGKLDHKPRIYSEVLGTRVPRVHYVQGDRTRGRIKNSGKPGFEVRVWRETGPKVELVSEDAYPVMDRIVETP